MSNEIEKFTEQLGNQFKDELKTALKETPPNTAYFKCMKWKHSSGWDGESLICRVFPDGILDKYIDDS